MMRIFALAFIAGGILVGPRPAESQYREQVTPLRQHPAQQVATKFECANVKRARIAGLVGFTVGAVIGYHTAQRDGDRDLSAIMLGIITGMFSYSIAGKCRVVEETRFAPPLQTNEKKAPLTHVAVPSPGSASSSPGRT